MAWNESGKGKNPWDGGSGNQGPPDLDELVRKMQRRLSDMFGGRGGSDGGGGGGGGGAIGFGLVAVVALVLWAASGLYKVDDAERGVVLRLGAYTKTTLPGLHWHIPWPIELVEKVNVSSVEKFQHSTRMLTADENIVVVDLAVQYQRADPKAFLFNVRDPEDTLSEVSESAIREVVGESPMDFLLREGRAEIARKTLELIQVTLDAYGTGIRVTSANLQDANFPDEVQAAVQDAIKAREDKDRLGLAAQSYANQVVPQARGLAQKALQDAEAYRERVIADADGNADRFLALLTEYQKAPGVTRERLYLETIEYVYANSTKVLMDSSGSGNLIYLPVDKLLDRPLRSGPSTSSMTSTMNTARPGVTETTRNTREDLRSRGNR